MLSRSLLIAILLFAFVIRIVGINYGLPQQFVADEFLMVAVSLKMLDSGSLRPYFPEIFYHQPFTAYISLAGIGGYLTWQLATGAFPSITVMKEFYSVHSSDLLIIVRFLSVLFGTATVFLLYLIGRDLFNKRTGILAAFFGAFEFLLVQFNHTGRVWSFLGFFVTLALWASVKVFLRGTRSDYIKSALASTAALMTLLPGIITFIPTLVARFSLKNKRLWLAGAILFLGVISALYLNPRGLGVFLLRFGIDISSVTNVVFKTPIPTELHLITQSWGSRLLTPFLSSFSYFPAYLILFFVGLVILWKENRSKFFFIASFPAVYYLFIGPFFSYGWVVRAMIPLVIYCIVVSAFAVDRLLQAKFFSKKPFFEFLFIGLVSAYSIYFSVLFDIKIVRVDTRTQALEWIYKNLPENVGILAYSNSNEVVNQNRGVLEKIKALAPQDLNTRQKTLLAGDDGKFPRPWYFAWDLRKTASSKVPTNFFKENNFRYYLRTRLGNEPEDYFEDIIENQFSEKKLIAVFNPYSGEGSLGGNNFTNNAQNPFKLLTIDRFGPTVEIYEVKFK